LRKLACSICYHFFHFSQNGSDYVFIFILLIKDLTIVSLTMLAVLKLTFSYLPAIQPLTAKAPTRRFDLAQE